MVPLAEWNPDCLDDPCDCPGEVRPAPLTTARVILFKASGKYYTEEAWLIPTLDEVLAGGGNRGDATIPYCMRFSTNFRRIEGGPILVVTQEPWGYPHLIPVDGLNPACPDHKLVQHRDLKPAWCHACGRAADGTPMMDPRPLPAEPCPMAPYRDEFGFNY